MIALTSILLWIAYCCVEGNRSALHYHYRMLNAVDDGFNEHSGFTHQRIIVWISFSFGCFDFNDKWTLLNSVFLALLFTFCHDGVYYWRRNKLDGSYPKEFLSNPSATSTSWLDNLGVTGILYRTVEFISGVFGLIIINCIK